ncbi:MAG TPA: prenyltransferase/squalene oxidase repeat-containing protein [Phycisphaerae bacterium]|nr:prenyltransferase/squalene oxidase repeat-containing protein [Phycisphaerae bacterium]
MIVRCRVAGPRSLGLWVVPAAVCLSAVAARAGQLPLPQHITPEAQEAIDAGLAYLARTQARDGAWRNRGSYGRYPVAMTSLAGLALLMNGNTTTQGPYAPAVDRAARFLVDSSTNIGLIARLDESEGRPMHGHGFAMLFLAELCGMTEDRDRQGRIHEVLTRAIDLTGRSQSDLGGWYYTPDSGEDEGSVTITQVQGLRACRNAGVAVPKEVIDQAMDYLRLSARSDGGIAYRARMRGDSRPPITAAAVCCWFNAGDYENPLALRALEFARRNISVRQSRGGHYFYAHLYLAQAQYLSGAEAWNEYFPQMRDHLIRLQNEDGSWRGDYVGNVYGTAIALIILQLPYNQLPIMQR